MKVSDIYTSESAFMRASDHKGINAIATIDDVGQDLFPGKHGREEAKLVITIKGKDQGIVLSKGNARTLADAFGDDTNKWAGKKINIQTKDYDIEGKQTTGFILSQPASEAQEWGEEQSKQAAAVAAEKDEFSDDIPF